MTITQQVIDNTAGAGEAAQSAFGKVNANDAAIIGVLNAIAGGTPSTVSTNATGFFYSQSGARVNRLADRVLAGDAAINDGQGPTNPVSADWLTLWQQSVGIPFGIMNSSQVGILTTAASLSVTSPVGLTVGTRTLTTNQSGQNAIGLAVYAINNSPTFANSVYGIYIESHRVNNTVNSSLGLEVDVTQRGSLVGINPYAQNFGQTVALQLASGAQQGVVATATFSTNVMSITLINSVADIGLIQTGWKVNGVGITPGTTITSFGTGAGGTGTYNLSTSPGTLGSRIISVSPLFGDSAAINIQANPTPFQTALNIGATAVAGGDGVTGTTPVPAITMAKNQGTYWYAPGGVSTGAIFCTSNTTVGSMQLQLGQGAFNVLELSSNGVNFQVSATNNAVNYPFVQAGISGSNAVTIGTVSGVGGDTNVDLGIFCAGTGILKFINASHITANGTVATTITSLGPAGSHTTIQEWLTIKNSAGVVRYIPCY